MEKIEIDEIHYTDYYGSSYTKALIEYPIFVSLIIENIGSSIEFVALWIERPQPLRNKILTMLNLKLEIIE